MTETMEASVTLVNEKLHFLGSAGGHPPIDIDYVPPLGDDLGHTPLQLVLLGLAACSGETVLTLLRRMKKTISGLEVKARGIRREEHPTSFVKITLEFLLKSGDTDDSSLENVIKLSRQTYCPVWAMLKDNVEIVSEHSVVS